MSKYKKFFGGVSSVVLPSLLIFLDGKKRKKIIEKGKIME